MQNKHDSISDAGLKGIKKNSWQHACIKT